MTQTTLVEKIVELHRVLRDADLDHAFGGALALAYCTAEPRATRDIDVNVFSSPAELDEIEAALPDEIDISEKQQRQLHRDAQTRLWWQDTPVDIFLSNHPFHDQARENRRFVPFAEVRELPVLACADLAVFKAFFGRAKDAVDMAAMTGAKAIDLDRIEHDVAVLLDSNDARSDFFALVRSAISDYEE